jgi:hypothetical protein
MPSRSVRRRSITRLALLCLVLAPAYAATPSPAERFLEEEMAAARKIDLYLVLSRGGTSLDVKARGIVLDTVPIQASTVLTYRTARRQPAPPALPGAWEVRREPEAEHRQLIAPGQLQPYDEEVAAAAAAKPPGVLPEPPSSYEVGLDGGWALRVVQETPEDSLWARLRQAVADGWRRLRRGELHRPPTLVLTMEATDGRRLHQLFREGRRILIDPSIPEPAGPAAD